jgi:hypothetical protein
VGANTDPVPDERARAKCHLSQNAALRSEHERIERERKGDEPSEREGNDDEVRR